MAHDDRGMIGILLFQMLEKSLFLVVHAVGLHDDHVASGTRPSDCVSSWHGAWGPGARVIDLICGALLSAVAIRLLVGAQPLVAFH